MVAGMIDREHRAVFTEQLRHRRGRPRRDTPIVITSIRLPADLYDALCRRALLERQSVHAELRAAVALLVASSPEFQ